MLDDVVGQQTAREFVQQPRVAGSAAHVEAQTGRRPDHRNDAELMRTAHDLLRHRIGDSGAIGHFNDVLGAAGPRMARIETAPLGAFSDRVAEQQGDQPFLVVRVERTLDEVQVRRCNVRDGLQPQRVGVVQQPARARVVGPAGGDDQTMDQGGHASSIGRTGWQPGWRLGWVETQSGF